MDKNKLIYILIVVLLAAAGLVYYFTQRSNDAADQDTQVGYSFEGLVILLRPDHVVINTSKVEKTNEGNKIVRYERTVMFAEKVIFIDGDETTEMEAEAVASHLPLGGRAVFYGSGPKNLSDNGEFTANRIEVLGNNPGAGS